MEGLEDYPTITVGENDFGGLMDDVLYFLLGGEVMGGCYFYIENEIYLYSFCNNMMDRDLPTIEEVVATVDHESMHWMLYNICGYWVSACFDNICRNIDGLFLYS